MEVSLLDWVHLPSVRKENCSLTNCLRIGSHSATMMIRGAHPIALVMAGMAEPTPSKRLMIAYG